jgi:diguanylate cyclase (GGDEF)-like protein
VEATEEARAFRAAGLVTCVPLVQQEEGAKQPQLEGFLLLGERLAGGPLGSFDRRLLGLLGQAVAITFHNEMLYRRSIVDDLTQVSSRGYFDAHLNREIGRWKRYREGGLSLLLMDLDRFKEINDRHGHTAGDEALRQAAQSLREGVRVVDVVARYGGEEFAIILVKCDRSSAAEVAERLRRALERLEVSAGAGRLRLTGSFGVACFPEDAEDKQRLIEVADRALYRAKAEGRNRVCVAGESGAGGLDGPGDGGKKK